MLWAWLPVKYCRAAPKLAGSTRRRSTCRPERRTMLDFVSAIRKGEQASPDFEDGLRCQEVLEAVERSDAEGRWLTLPLE